MKEYRRRKHKNPKNKQDNFRKPKTDEVLKL
jgi:hypothetical protein